MSGHPYTHFNILGENTNLHPILTPYSSTMWDFLRHTGISRLAKFLYGII